MYQEGRSVKQLVSLDVKFHEPLYTNVLWLWGYVKQLRSWTPRRVQQCVHSATAFQVNSTPRCWKITHQGFKNSTPICNSTKYSRVHVSRSFVISSQQSHKQFFANYHSTHTYKCTNLYVYQCTSNNLHVHQCTCIPMYSEHLVKTSAKVVFL